MCTQLYTSGSKWALSIDRWSGETRFSGLKGPGGQDSCSLGSFGALSSGVLVEQAASGIKTGRCRGPKRLAIDNHPVSVPHFIAVRCPRVVPFMSLQSPGPAE